LVRPANGTGDLAARVAALEAEVAAVQERLAECQGRSAAG
jgi:uncharacterized protein YceH (UPF0502 family)